MTTEYRDKTGKLLRTVPGTLPAGSQPPKPTPAAPAPAPQPKKTEK